MHQNFYKSTGISLVSGSLLIIVTMVLHPTGGSLAGILAVKQMTNTAHSIAIFSLPIVLFGFYGLTQRLMDSSQLARLAFYFVLFGLIAGMMAAVFNGLGLPDFLSHYADDLETKHSILGPISSFSFSVNKALDYIFISGICVALTIYALLNIRLGKLPKWIGYFGLIIMLFVLVGLSTGFVFNSLAGFRIFTFSLAGWILAAGISLTKSKPNHEQGEN